MATIAERIRLALSIRNMRQTDLVEKTGIGKSSISTYISGEYEPKQRNIYKIAKALNVSEAWLMGYDVPIDREQLPSPNNSAARIPVLGRVVAGIPLEAVEEILDWEEIPQSMAETGVYYALQIKGDSMEPKISDGDVVIVRQQEDVESGEVAIVLVNGEEATVKKIKKTTGGIQLLPTNPTYDPIFYTSEEVETLPVRIIGKVVELRAKF